LPTKTVLTCTGFGLGWRLQSYGKREEQSAKKSKICELYESRKKACARYIDHILDFMHMEQHNLTVKKSVSNKWTEKKIFVNDLRQSLVLRNLILILNIYPTVVCKQWLMSVLIMINAIMQTWKWSFGNCLFVVVAQTHVQKLRQLEDGSLKRCSKLMIDIYPKFAAFGHHHQVAPFN